MWDDGLDAIDWSALEDAYGPAVDVPDQLRLLASGGEDWDEGLAALEAGVFHQGNCFDATPIAVRYLVRMLEAARQAPVASVLGFLARLSMGHLGDVVQGFDPLVFRSAPPSADYPEGAATVEAVAAGSETYLRLLAHPEPGVRAAAAFVVAGIPSCAERALGVLPEALQSETDALAKASLVLCCGRHAGAQLVLPLTTAEPLLVRGAATIALAWCGEGFPESLTPVLVESALCNDVFETFPWGEEGGLAALAIGALALRRDRASLEHALRTRLGREERAWRQEFPQPGQPYVVPDEQALVVDTALRALAAVCAPLVFPVLYDRDELALPGEVAAAQRDLLLQAARAGLPLPLRAVPWFELEHLERFLAEGDGPLEAPLSLPGGRRDVTWRALRRAGDKDRPPGELAAVFEALFAQRTPLEVLELCWDLLSGAYPGTSGYGGCLTFNQWGPLLAHLEQHAEALEPRLLELARESHPAEAPRAEVLARPLFALAKRRGEPLNSSFDDQLFAALYSADREWASDLLRALPLERRSAWVGRLRNAYTIAQYIELCDRDEVRRHVLESLNDWDRHAEQARQLLTQLFNAAELSSAIEQHRLDPEANAEALRYLEQAQRALIPEHRLEVTHTDAGLRCVFRTAAGDELRRTDVAPHPKLEELASLFERLPDALRIVLDFDDHSLGYRLQRLFSELGVLSVRFGNSSIER